MSAQEPHFEAKIQEAMVLKQQGNGYFKELMYEFSRSKYQQALVMLHPNQFNGATEEQCKQLAELSANLLFNVGTCCYNQQKWRDADLIYSQALIINPLYVKAIFKRAMARHELNDYENAMEDIKKAYELDKSNSDIKEGYEKIRVRFNQEMKKDNEKRKELSSRMFDPNGVKKEGEGQQDENEGKGWWMLGMVPLAAVALYQGFKYFKD